MLLLPWEEILIYILKYLQGKIQEILRKEFELSEELEITLKKIAQNKD